MSNNNSVIVDSSTINGKQQTTGEDGIKFIINFIILTSSLFSIIFNLILCYILIKIELVWNRFNIQLVVPVACLDLLTGLIIATSCIISEVMVDGLAKITWFCPIVGNLSIIMACTSMILVSALAVERYLTICRNVTIDPKRGWPCLSILVLPLILVSILNGILDGFKLGPLGTFCVPRGNHWSNLQYHFMLCIQVISLICIVISYTSIFIRCYFMDRPNNYFMSKKFSFKFLIPLLLYCLSWLPKVIYVLHRIGHHENSPSKGLTLISFSLSILFNPILVIYLQNKIKLEFFNLLLPCWSPQQSTETSTDLFLP